MRILFLTSEGADYLSDSLLHGLRGLLGANVVDYPKADRLYRTYPAVKRSELYGRGFTLYGLLNDIPIDRDDIHTKVRRSFFDLVLFGSIWRNWKIYQDLREFLSADRTVLVDGEDNQNIFPYACSYLKDKKRILIPRGRRYRYFKRELTVRSLRSQWYFMLSQRLVQLLPFPKRIFPISFSIPAEKIALSMPAKTDDFPVHIVDREIAVKLDLPQPRYPFRTEEEYYANLQRSRFGITTRRSGWDCMRHYEIAANGAVMCFRGLDAKEPTCAPHGLDSDNCIPYTDFDDLMRKIDGLSPSRYQALRERGIAWAQRNTTAVRANEFLSSLNARKRTYGTITPAA
jgi:hypothetical protein